MRIKEPMLAILGCSFFSHAFPSFRDALPNGGRVPCNDDIGGCDVGQFDTDPPMVCSGVGHATCVGGTHPLNAFGEDFASAGFRWTYELCMKDSDGDGLTNGQELGDPCCSWKIGDEDPMLLEYTPSHPGFRSSALGELEVGYCGVEPSLSRLNESSLELLKSGTDTLYEEQFYLDGENRKSIELRIDHHQVEASPTTYDYFALNFDDPDCEESECYIVGFESLVDDAKHVHHFVLNGCEHSFRESQHGKKVFPLQGSCDFFLGGWVPGRNVMLLAPARASIPFGGKSGRSLRSFVLNVHYNNPDLDIGSIDSSGFRMRYTTKPRNFALGALYTVMLRVDPTTWIPPHQERYFITKTCQIVGGDEELTLNSVGFHAHLLAREMYLTLYKNGTRVDLLGDPHWSYDDQYTKVFPEGSFTFSPGDVFQTTCVYNSMGESRATVIGEETTDEMCAAAITYWPEQQDLHCEYSRHWTGSAGTSENLHAIRELHPKIIGAYSEATVAHSRVEINN